MSNVSSVIEKVRKLLALSKSTNANEAANAMAAANRLIDEYRLSESDIGVNGEEDPLMEDSSYIYETGRNIPWKVSLLYILTNHYGLACVNLIDKSSGRKKSQYKLVGRKSDIQIVQYMFAWLQMECQRLANIEVKGCGHVAVFSYCEGFVVGIAEQLRLTREEMKQKATEAAIIKIDSRLQESKDYLNTLYKTKKIEAKSYRQVDKDAFSAGQTKGKALHLGNSMGGKPVKMLNGK